MFVCHIGTFPYLFLFLYPFRMYIIACMHLSARNWQLVYMFLYTNLMDNVCSINVTISWDVNSLDLRGNAVASNVHFATSCRDQYQSQYTFQISLIQIPKRYANDISILVYAMAWCRQTTSLYYPACGAFDLGLAVSVPLPIVMGIFVLLWF